MRAVVSWRNWIVFPLLTVILSGCFQSANDNVSPTRTNLTGIAPADGLTAAPAPFVTPISTGGFITPTDDPLLLTLSAQPPVITSIPTDVPGGVFAPTQPGNSNPAAPTDAGNAIVAPVLPTAPSVVMPTPTALPTEGPCIHTVQPGEW